MDENLNELYSQKLEDIEVKHTHSELLAKKYIQIIKMKTTKLDFPKTKKARH